MNTDRPAGDATDRGEEPPTGRAAAEALSAAVRAVESGERPASSFFTERPSAGPGSSRPGPSGSAGPAADGPAPAARSPRPQVPRTGLPEAERIARTATVREALAAGGAPESLAESVVAALGESAAQALREDPWQLLGVPGVRVEQADGFARAALGPECGPGDERRTRALVGHLLERAALEGHTALDPDSVTAGLERYGVPEPPQALNDAIADGSVLVFQDALDSAASPSAAAGAVGDEAEERPVRVLVGLDRYALAEESLADGFARLINTFEPSSEDAAAAWEQAAATAPSASAAELIRASASAGLVAHTGGEEARAEPAALVAAARGLGLRAFAAAHTPEGRGRLTGLLDGAPTGAGDSDAAGSSGGAALTLDGLLSGTEGPARDEEGRLALDVLAVLDASQLDVERAAALAESLPDGARLVLSGDPGVLWSAGPGRVFADLLASRACPHVVSRTPDPGPIGELVSSVGAGELPQVDAPGREVVIVPVRDAGEAVHRTVQLVADSVPRAIGIPADSTQVIVPAHGGPTGTRALNAALKEHLNPGPGRFGGFDPGDRVAHTRGTGHIVPGTVVSADADGLHLSCDDGRVVVPPEQVPDRVRHGWAITAHQAAGARWPAAVVVVPGDAGPLLTRAWVYTAFGRGERHLSVVHGADQQLPRAVRETPARERTTRLRTLLAPAAG
ncbi:helix-hairpin-helix domain-containing protein [Streptomyces meridianus]|uniref:helix-hairpin-helix domain-containing protein n=1 Tax=Streptomyces meridianus TaxID=2938945 RepID=UPI0035575AAC